MHVGRDFRSNALDGTIPAALSELKLLSFLCACPACDAAPCACERALRPVGVRTRPCVRVHALSHRRARAYLAVALGSTPRVLVLFFRSAGPCV